MQYINIEVNFSNHPNKNLTIKIVIVILRDYKSCPNKKRNSKPINDRLPKSLKAFLDFRKINENSKP